MVKKHEITWKSILYPQIISVVVVLARFLRILAAVSRSKLDSLIVSPAAAGSLGDQALVSACVRRLDTLGAKKVGVLTEDGEENVDGERTRVNFYQGLLGRAGLISQIRFCFLSVWFERLYVIGADIMDGFYAPGPALIRLELIKMGDRCGMKTALIGFSFNKNPSQEIVERLRSLSSKTRFVIRDEDSHARFRSIVGKEAIYGADLAFLIAPVSESPLFREYGKWASEQRARGRLILCINLNRHVVEKADAVVKRFSSLIHHILERAPNAAFALMPHDIRGQRSDAVLNRELFSLLSSETQDRTFILPCAASAAEAKSVFVNVDLVVTQRMHLGIAALGMKVPAFCFDYQDKVAGMLSLFGLRSLSLDLAELGDVSKLAARIVFALENREQLRQAIVTNLPQVEKMAQTNIE